MHFTSSVLFSFDVRCSTFDVHLFIALPSFFFLRFPLPSVLCPLFTPLNAAIGSPPKEDLTGALCPLPSVIRPRNPS